MAKLNDDGTLSGHIGNVVYRDVRGKQHKQSMPSHYRDAKTETQLKQRSGMRNILAFYRILKDVVKSQFEDAIGPHRPYDCFKHHNLLLPAVDLPKKDYNGRLAIPAPYIVSHGSLAPLEQTIVDGCLQFQLKSEQWKKGDILRFIRVKPNDADEKIPTSLYSSYSDTFIEDITERPITSEPLTYGLYTYVHLRQSRKGLLVSTQKLIIV